MSTKPLTTRLTTYMHRLDWELGRAALMVLVLAGTLAACTPPELDDMPPASEEDVTTYSTVEWVDGAEEPAGEATEVPAGDLTDEPGEAGAEDAAAEASAQLSATAQPAAPANATGGSASEGSSEGAPTAARPAAAPAKRGLTLAVAEDSALGPHLVDGEGRTLYLFQRDTTSRSTCTDACTGTWPPALTDATPLAGEGVDAALLGITLRDDGRAQVTYAEHPLYYFAGDEAAGTASGQGALSLWYVVSPAGTSMQ